MSVFDNKNKKNSKKNFAFVEDKSIDLNQTPKSIEELNKAGRGSQRKDTATTIAKPKGKAGRPKLEHIQEKEVVSLFLTKEQKEELRQRAKKADLPMTKYIIIKLFGLDI